MEYILDKVILKMKQNHAFLLELKNIDYDNFEKILLNKLRTADIHLENIKIIKPEKNVIKIGQISEIKLLFKYENINNYNIYLIFSAEKMNREAFNSLLKFLEEPHNKTVAILITENNNLIPETIKSRCIIYKSALVQNENDLDFQMILNLINNNDYISYQKKITEKMEENNHWFDEFLIFVLKTMSNTQHIMAINNLLVQSKNNINKNLLIDELYYIIINKEI